MILANLVLLAANVVYRTSYVATRLTLAAVPPATVALLRLALGGVVLVVWALARVPAAATAAPSG